MKTSLITIANDPNAPALLLDKKGQVLQRFDSAEQAKAEVRVQDGTKDRTQVLEIHRLRQQFMRTIGLPAKSLTQFKDMLPHQIRLWSPSISSQHELKFEFYPLASTSSAHIRAQCFVYSASEIQSLTQAQSSSSHTIPTDNARSKPQMISEHLCLLYHYQELLSQLKKPCHLFHQHGEQLWHLHLLEDGNLEMHSWHTQQPTDSDALAQKLISHIEERQLWQWPQEINLACTPTMEVSPLQQHLPDGVQLNMLKIDQSYHTHAERLLHGASLHLQNPKAHSQLLEHDPSQHPQKTKHHPALVAGIGLLFFLGCSWIANSLRIQRLEDQNKQLLSSIHRLHKQTLPAGQRRSFSEMTLLRRLSLQAKKMGNNSQAETSFIPLLQNVQAVLEKSPEFQLDRLQSRPSEARLQLQGSVKSVQDFDELTQAFEQHQGKTWKVQSNFNRSKGKDLRVNISLEGKP